MRNSNADNHDKVGIMTTLGCWCWFSSGMLTITYRYHQFRYPGVRFTNGFSIAIQIRSKFRFILTSILIQRSLQNFVHGSCAVVACAKICCDLMASNEIMARTNFHQIWIAGKKRLWNGPRLSKIPQPYYLLQITLPTNPRRNANSVTLTTFSSFNVPEFVNMTTSGANNDTNFAKMSTFPFQFRRKSSRCGKMVFYENIYLDIFQQLSSVGRQFS